MGTNNGNEHRHWYGFLRMRGTVHDTNGIYGFTVHATSTSITEFGLGFGMAFGRFWSFLFSAFRIVGSQTPFNRPVLLKSSIESLSFHFPLFFSFRLLLFEASIAWVTLKTRLAG